MVFINEIFAFFSSSALKSAMIVFVAALAVIFIAMYITEAIKKSRKYTSRLEKRLELTDDDVLEAYKNSNRYSATYEKYLKPYIRNNPKKFRSILKTIGIDLETIQKQLLRADVTDQTPEQMASLKIAGLFLGTFVGASSFMFLGIASVAIGLGIYMYLGVFPFSRLAKIYDKRKSEIKDTLPTYLRFMADATSVGLTVEEAIKRVSQKYDCLLSDEFKKVEKEARLTGNWASAMEAMAFKNDIDELYSLVSEIRISKDKGTPITELLIRHAEKMDNESSLRASEVARKKSTTLIVPIFIFLFVPLLGVIMLPAADLIMTQL